MEFTFFVGSWPESLRLSPISNPDDLFWGESGRSSHSLCKEESCSSWILGEERRVDSPSKRSVRLRYDWCSGVEDLRTRRSSLRYVRTPTSSTTLLLSANGAGTSGCARIYFLARKECYLAIIDTFTLLPTARVNVSFSCQGSGSQFFKVRNSCIRWTVA